MVGIAHRISIMKHPGISTGSNEKQLQRLHDNLLVGVVVHCSDTSILQCNPASTEILGLTAEQMAGRRASDPIWNFVHDDLSPMSPDDYPVNRVISSNEILTDYLFGIIRPDRDYVTWVNVNAIPEFTETGILEEVFVYFSDVTSRKQTENALRESEERFKAAFESANDCILIWDREFNYLYANQTAIDHVGTTPDKVIGKNIRDGLGHIPDFMHLWMNRIDQVFESGDALEVLDSTMMQGELIHTSSILSPVLNEQNEVTAVCAVYRDITQIKRTEDALRESERKLRNIFDNSTNLFYSHTPDHILTYLSPQVEEMLGYTTEEAMIKWTELSSDNPINKIGFDFTVRAIETCERQPPYELELVKKNGEMIWVEIREFPLVENGKTTAISGSLTDITDRKNAENELRNSEAKFRNIFENKGTATGIFGDDGIIADCNTKFSEMCGYSKTEIIGKMKWSAFVVQEDLEWMLKYHAQRTGKVLPPPSQYECRINHSDGTIHCVLVNIALTGNMRVVSLIDVTDLKRAENEIRRMQRLEGLGTIAGGIAHDFNNLLTGIFTNIEMAMIDLPRRSSSDSYLQDARNAIHSARQLTGQLLTFAKGSAPVLSTVDTSALVRDTVNFNLHGSNVISSIMLQDNLWLINVDKGQIGQVLANLLINAKQSMPQGGTLHIDARNIQKGDLIDSPDAMKDWVCITIRDEGTGIPPKIIEHIFDPYFSTKDTGHGLGLAIVNSIIEQHDGSISVTSETNIGTTVNIFLPAVPASEGEDIADDSHDDTASNDSPSLRVLLMDDEEILRKVGRLLIERLGHTIDTAVDGVEALHKYNLAMEIGDPFDLVIMDLTIRGGKGGQETMKELLEIDPKVRAIVSSGYASDPIMADCTAYGFSGRLAKPFTMQDLEREIIRVMGMG